MIVKPTYTQIKGIFNTVREAVGYISNLSEENYARVIGVLLSDLSEAVKEINLKLLDNLKVNFCDMDYLEGKVTDYAGKEKVIEQYGLWQETMQEVLERQYKAENVWDAKFIKLMDYVRYVDFDSMVENAKNSLDKQGDLRKEGFCQYYQGYSDMWGTLDIENNRYDVITNRVTALMEHREDFIWLYHKLGDWRSKQVLTSMLYSWIIFDKDYIFGMKEANFPDYFDLDLVKCDDKEVIVDLGAWIGDSMLNYINTYGCYQKIYCYEIDEENMKKVKANLGEYPDIEFRRKGAGSENGRMYVDGYIDSSCNRVVEKNTGKEIEIVSIDDDIDERITLIKMDIEGAEQKALLGCRRHIQEETPKLLISVYHNNEDIWKIPRMIEEIKSGYRFYLRSNGEQWGPAEIVLFAI
ncbi:MAG: FkbM family methyltransferase [Clostridium sp.]|nr:FkbM family methyltransferase [Clostridium sp.]